MGLFASGGGCIKGAMLGNRPMSEWVAQYRDQPSTSGQPAVPYVRHSDDRGVDPDGDRRLLHAVVVDPGRDRFVIGWILQFIGHYFEGEKPEFFKDWRFLFVGLRWWLAKISGKA